MTTNQSQYEEMIIPGRCKDCRFFRKTFKPEYGVETDTCGHLDAMLNPKPDDYCSRGEWGTNETN